MPLSVTERHSHIRGPVDTLCCPVQVQISSREPQGLQDLLSRAAGEALDVDPLLTLADAQGLHPVLVGGATGLVVAPGWPHALQEIEEGLWGHSDLERA